eukprot:jgi/Hompol1/6117/HPOL_000710-RA
MPATDSRATDDSTDQSATAAAADTADLNTTADDSAELQFDILNEDIPFEEDCLRHPHSVAPWLRYWRHLQGKGAAVSLDAKLTLLGRALQHLPGSYKLWKLLLDLRVDHILAPLPSDSGSASTSKNAASKADKAADDSAESASIGFTLFRQRFPLRGMLPSHPEWLRTNAAFEQSLASCNKYPVIWLSYCTFLMHQPSRISLTRRTFDRALQALPSSQHKRIWDLYLQFAEIAGGETCVRVWRRFLKIEPHQAERFVTVLLNLEPPRIAEAASVLATIVMNPKFASPKSGKTSFQYWIELCDLVCDHPHEISQDSLRNDRLVSAGDNVLLATERLDVERIIRAGITRFTDQVGKLWNSLARWWIVRGEFDRAREVYEEALRRVNTVRDFTIVFDAYAKMEEDIITANMQRLADKQGDDNQDNNEHIKSQTRQSLSNQPDLRHNHSDEDDDDDEENGKPNGKTLPAADFLDEIDIDLRLARFEKLMDRRPFLVNEVFLRQNPHNINEWQTRTKLFREKEQHDKVIETFLRAVDAVSPHKAVGKLSQLWIDFAKYYEETGDLDKARSVFEQAVKSAYKTVDELADVWCQWAEMEIRHDAFTTALEILGRATSPPRGPPAKHSTIRYEDENRSVQQRLFKSIKLWSFYVDVEESIGSPESTKAVYDRIMELKIANPQTIINYASFLEENKFFEESFRVYERGIELFGYPIAFEIWNLYLTKFIARYSGTKMERTRDLFEQALDNCPPKFAKTLLLLYAKLEEEHGLARHAMRIYDRATRVVGNEDRAEMFQIYIAKSTSFFGLVSTREIYQRALETLPDRQARDIAIKFADMEVKLGEVDRSRAILAYASQFSDPRIDPAFWRNWHEFEVKFGNEDTFKEMLRIKRSVQAKYNTQVGFISSQILAARQASNAQFGGQASSEAGKDQPDTANAAGTKNTGTRVVGFVRAKETEPKPKQSDASATAQSANPDEIEIDDDADGDGDDKGGVAAANPDEIEIGDDDDDDDNIDGGDDQDDGPRREITKIGAIQRQAVPLAVFGGLATDGKNDDDDAKLGAKDRFKRKRGGE